MAGYTRNDTSNNIADGNVINASDLDGEFDAIETAFNETTGHTHGGTAGDGAPITQLGPAQDIVANSTDLTPKTTNLYSLGTTLLRWKDLFVEGAATLSSVVISGGSINNTVIGNTTPADATFDNATVSGTLTASIGFDDVTGTVPISKGGTGANDSTTALTNLGFTASIAELNHTDGVTSGIQSQLDSLTSSVSTKANTNSPSLTGSATADNFNVTGSFSLGGAAVSATPIEINVLDGITASTAELNYTDGVTSSIQTQLNSKAPLTTPSFTGSISIDAVSVDGVDLTYLKDLLATGVTDTEFNRLDGLTASASELNKMDGCTSTTTELNKLDGVGTLYHTGNPPPSVGVNQTPQDMSGSRSSGTSYRNTTGEPIFVGIEKRGGGGFFQVSSNNSTWIDVAGFPGASGSFEEYYVGFVVPDDWYYRIDSGGYERWTEVR